MSLEGMDIDAATGLAGRLQAQASVVNGIIGAVDGVVSALSDVWHGDDMEAFADAWRRGHRPGAVATASDLASCAGQLRKEIAQQQAASGSGIGAGGEGSFVGLPGDVGGASAMSLIGLLGLGGSLVSGSWIYKDVDELTGGFDTEKTLIDGLKLSTLEDLPGGAQRVIGGLQELEGSSIYKGGTAAMGLLDGVMGGYQAWQDITGESTVARDGTAVATGAADLTLSRFPVTAGANLLSGGALQADANWGVQVAGGFVDGFEKDGIGGGLHEANEQWNDWANGIANGGGPLSWVAHGVDDAVSATYGPVSRAMNDVVSVATHPGKTAEQVASKAVSIVGNLL